MTVANKREQIWKSLEDREYRHQYVEEEINVGIAFQIRSIRNRKNLTQSDLANLLDIRQPLVSSWEDPNYGKYTLKTLKELAKAFDVGLLVKFVPFSSIVDWTADLKPENIAPSSFEEEQRHSLSFTSTALNAFLDRQNVAIRHFSKGVPTASTVEPTNFQNETYSSQRELSVV
ncbi:helix-turn-helix transcriptional regulator [Chloroflexota bacterium]